MLVWTARLRIAAIVAGATAWSAAAFAAGPAQTPEPGAPPAPGPRLIAQAPQPSLAPPPSLAPQPILGQPLESAPAPAPAPAGVVSSIRVEGNQRVDAGTVISYMKLQTGDRFDRQRLDDSLKALFATGYFQDVRFQRNGGELVVVVRENPVINRIAFEGNRRIEDNILSAELQLKPRLVYTVSRAQTDAQRIVEVYRRSGRFNVRVEPKLIELEQNRVDVVFEIDEGELTEIHRIVFIGNKRFSDSELRTEINTSETAWYRFLSSDDIYDPDRLAFDQELLRKFYLRNGYVDFQVVSAVAELAPDKEGFIITFTVSEGEQYDVASVEVRSQLPDLDSAVLTPTANEIEVDEPYDVEAVDRVVQELTDEVGRYGYAFVDVRPRVNRRRDERKVDVLFEVGEGPRVYVERIDIVGNVRTLDEVVRREMRLAEGDAFNRAKVAESERRIRRLGFFETVKIENAPADAPDRTIVTVEVTEKATGELSFGAGVSSDSGVLANVSLRERNLLGRGQDLLLSFALSFEDAELDLAFTEPYFLNRPLAAGFDIFASERDRLDESNFKQQTIGGGLRIGYELAPNLRQNWSYQLRQDDIKADDDASRFILAQEGKSITSRVAHRLSYDKTDNFFAPTEGYRLSLENALAGLGGDVRYFSTETKGAYFYPVFDQVIFSLAGRAGAIMGLGDDVRLNDRFFLGGVSFRGFNTAGVGARDAATNDALGGNYFYLGTVELGFPLGLPDEVGLTGRVFAEAGSLFGVDDDGAGVLDSSDPRASIGVGVTWNSPFGPLRVDLGYAVLKEDFDETEVLSFTFGTRF